MDRVAAKFSNTAVTTIGSPDLVWPCLGKSEKYKLIIKVLFWRLRLKFLSYLDARTRKVYSDNQIDAIILKEKPVLGSAG